MIVDRDVPPKVPGPALWKLSLLAWIVIYPLVNVLTFIIGPWIESLPQLVRTLILTGILAPSMVVIMSMLQRRLVRWLRS